MGAEALETPAVPGIDQLESLHRCIITETTWRPISNPGMGARRR